MAESPPSGTVTFLFTDIVDSTRLWEEHPDAMRDALVRHDAIVREAVTGHGGHVVKLTGDGVHAAFVNAHDGLASAIGAQLALAEEEWGPTGPLVVRMGLHTGEAYERDGDYFGQSPNRAARVMGLAHGGQILVSEVTEELVRGAVTDPVRLVDVGEQRLRGLPRPVRLFQVSHPALPTSFPSLRSLDAWLETLMADVSVPFPARLAMATTLAGRNKELDALDACWADVDGGALRLAVVAGEPGIGKTALVAAMAARAHAGGGAVLYGRCDQEFGVAYEPFVEALGNLVAHLPEPLLGAHFEEYGAHLARLIPSLNRYLRGDDPSRGADSDEQRFQLFASIAALLAMVSRAAPVMLVLDDLHWADTTTIALLRHLVGRAEPMRVLVAGTYRDSEVTVGHPFQEVLTASRSPAMERITLQGLDDQALVEMLEQAAGHTMDESGLQLADALRRETGGNPFFVAELLRHLVETGAIYRGDTDRWQLRGTIAELGLPDSARAVIGQRAERLGAPTKQVLSAAAVIGQDFELPLLAAVADQDGDQVLDHLERAEQAALVRNLAGEMFQFRHALVQHALYDDLGAARRGRLHLRVAECLETLGLADARPDAAAHHLAASGRPDALVAAIGYSRRAGDAAVAALAPDQGAQHYREALRMLDETNGPDEQRCAVLIDLGRALRQAGDGQYREVLLDAAALAERLGDGDQLVAAALANFRGWASQSGHVDEQRVAVLEAALVAVGPADSSNRARLLATLASELTFGADFDRRRALSDEAVGIARRLDDLPALAVVLASRFDSVRAPYLLDERRQAVAENTAVARRLDDPMALWLAVGGELQIAAETGDIDTFQERLELNTQLVDEMRQPYPRWLTLVHQTVRLTLAGRLDEAEQLGTEAFELGQEIAQPDAFAIYAGTLFWVWAARGRSGELLPILEEASAANPGIPGLLAALASAYCDADRRPQAQAVLDTVRQAGFDAIGVDGVWTSTMFIFGAVAAVLRDRAAAQELLTLLEPYERQFAADGAHIQGTIAQILGRLAAVLGRDEESDAWFAVAEELEEGARAVLMLAQTRSYWAEALARRDTADDRATAGRLAEAARATGIELGSPPVVERAARVLDALGSPS